MKKGGVLVYCGRDDDPYQTVMEWWNTKGNNYKAPSAHLFELLKISPPTSGDQRIAVGKGAVYVIRQHPKEFVLETKGAGRFVELIKQAYEKDAKAGKLNFKNNFYLKRGPYDIVSVMDESISDQPYIVNEPVIDLFDPQLPVLAKKTVAPGEQSLLYNLGRVRNKKQPQVLAAASRVYQESGKCNSYSFVSKSPVNTTNSMRILLPKAPVETELTDSKGERLKDVKTSWDAGSGTYYLSFENSPEGTTVNLK